MGCTHGSLSRNTEVAILANTKPSEENLSPPISRSVLNPPIAPTPSNQDSSPPSRFHHQLSGKNPVSFAPILDVSRPETRFARDQNKVSFETSELRSKTLSTQKKNFTIVRKEKLFSQLISEPVPSSLDHKPYLFHARDVATARVASSHPTEPTCVQEDEIGSYRHNRVSKDPPNVAAPTVLRRRLQKEPDSAQSGIFGNLQDYEKFIRRMSSKMVIGRQKKNNLLEGSKDSDRLRASKTLKEGKTLPLIDSPDIPTITIKKNGILSSCRKVRTGEFRLLSTFEKKKPEPQSTFSREQESPVHLDRASTEGQFSKATEALKKKLSTMVRSGLQQTFRSSTSVNEERYWEAAQALGGDLAGPKIASPPRAEPKKAQPKLHRTATEAQQARWQLQNPNSAAELTSILRLLQSPAAVPLESQ